MKKAPYILIVLLLSAVLAGCTYNRAPIVVATQTQTQLQARRTAEENYWLDRLKLRRIEFEEQLDRFVVGSQRDAEEAGLLTAPAVAKIQREEAILREEFDENEREAMRLLAENLKWYDDLIELQQKIIESEIQTERARGEAVERIAKQLEQYTEMLTAATNERRSRIAEDPSPIPVVRPSTEAIAIVDAR